MDTKDARTKVIAEYTSLKIVGKGIEEGNQAETRTAYLHENGDIAFVDASFTTFLRLPPERIFEQLAEEVWFKIFHGRGWYAVKLEDGTYDCRFSER